MEEMGSGNKLQRQRKGPRELKREKGEGNAPAEEKTGDKKCGLCS